MTNIFDDTTEHPCPVCMELAQSGKIPLEAVMPLPTHPARHLDNRQCCRDCEATVSTMRLLQGQHPDFEAARLTVANERLEGLRMPPGMMENFGMCKTGLVRPCSCDDLEEHIDWVNSHVPPYATVASAAATARYRKS